MYLFYNFIYLFCLNDFGSVLCWLDLLGLLMRCSIKDSYHIANSIWAQQGLDSRWFPRAFGHFLTEPLQFFFLDSDLWFLALKLTPLIVLMLGGHQLVVMGCHQRSPD